MVGRQLPIFSVIVPFWLVAAQAGWRGMIGVWPACLVAGGSFGLMQFIMSNFHGPWLVDIVSAAVSMFALVVLMRFWQPKDTTASTTASTTAATTASTTAATAAATAKTAAATATGPAWKAWIPWVFLTGFVFLWGLPVIKNQLNDWYAPKIAVPFLHKAVEKMPPVAPKPELENALFTLNLLSATGTALLLAGVLSAICLDVGARRAFAIYGQTLVRVRISLLTISVMMALGFTTRYSGSSPSSRPSSAGSAWPSPEATPPPTFFLATSKKFPLSNSASRRS
jgi:lactate permease